MKNKILILLNTAILIGCSTTFSGIKQRPIFTEIDYSNFNRKSTVLPVFQTYTAKAGPIVISPDGMLMAFIDRNMVTIRNEEGILLSQFYKKNSTTDKACYSSDGRSLFLYGSSLGRYELDGTELSISLNTPKYSIFSVDPVQNLIVHGYGSITNDHDFYLKLMDSSGREILKISGIRSQTTALEFSQDGQFFASGQIDGSIKIYDLEGTTRWTSRKTGKKVVEIRFSPDGSCLATAYDDNTVQLFNLETGSDNTINSFEKTIINLFYTWDNKLFIHSGEISVWDRSGKIISEKFHGNTALAMEYNPVEDSVIIAAEEALKKYNSALELEYSISNDSVQFREIELSEDTGYIAAQVWQPSSGISSIALIHTDSLETHFLEKSGGFEGIRFSPDNSMIFAYGANILAGWDLISGERLFVYQNDNQTYFTCMDINSMRNIIFAGDKSGDISLFDFNGRQLDYYSAHDRAVSDLVCHPNGKILASAGYDNRIKLWDTEYKVKAESELQCDALTKLGFSPDGRDLYEFRTFSSFPIDGDFIARKIELEVLRRSRGAVNPDGTYLAVLKNPTGFQIRRNSGELYRDFQSLTAIGDIAFSTDGKYVFTIEGNSIGLYSIADKRQLHIVFTGDIDNWYCIDNKGRFDCSDGGREEMVFARGTEVHSAGQYWQSFFVPGLLVLFLEMGELPDIDIYDESENVPIVFMERMGVEDNILTVRVIAKGAGNGLGELFISRNNRTLTKQMRGLEVLFADNESLYRIPLTEGENRIIAGCWDKDKKVYGVSDTLIEWYAPPAPPKPELYVFCVGVGDYRDDALDLGAPATDAEDIADLFTSAGRNLYDSVHKTLIINGSAGKNQIENSLNSIIDLVKPIDTVIVFFAGHGFIEQNEYYFLPYDADILDIEKSCFSIDQFAEFIETIPAQKIALLFDTCQSGAAVRELGTVAMSRNIEEKKIIADLAQAQGIAIFSAASATQSAYEIPQLGNGIFTYSIKEAINQHYQEVQLEGYISLGKLLSMVNMLTKETSKNYLNITQNPSLYFFGSDFYLGKLGPE